MAADAIRAGGIEVVLLDALGTLIELQPPWPFLVDELAARGIEVDQAAARSALLEEMTFYRAHTQEAGDRDALARLRRRCTQVLRDALPPHASAIDLDELEAALLASLRFRAYPEVAAVLGALRSAGTQLAVVSNWDVSLHDVLERTGLAPLVDVVIASAEVGFAKPDPRIFALALARVGAAARAAVHVGDRLDDDVAGALAAGIRPVLVARAGVPAAVPDGVAVIATLAGLPETIL